jgi:POT family proton-dependent oligopeptide transporter
MFADGAFRMPLIFLVLMYMLHTTGEMCMSPVGLSQMTKLSPAAVVSFMMAVWFMAVAIAQYVGGIIAGLTTTETVGGQVLDPAAALATSLQVFNVIGLVSMGIGVLFLVLLALAQEVVARLGRHRRRAGRHGDDDPLAVAPLG